MKWSGVSISYKDNYHDLYEYFKVDDNGGVYLKDIERYIKNKKLPFKLVKKYIGFDHNIAYHLQMNKAVLIGYSTTLHHNHVAIITEYKNFKFNLINHNRTGKLIQYVNSEKLQNWTKFLIVVEKK